jgi:hypothetical protein
MNSPHPTIRSGLKIPHLDGTNDHLVFSREHWNLIIAVANAILSSPNFTVTNHGIILEQTGSAGEVDYLKDCLADGSTCYVPVRVAGTIYRLPGTGTVTPTIDSGSVPTGSQELV